MATIYKYSKHPPCKCSGTVTSSNDRVKFIILNSRVGYTFDIKNTLVYKMEFVRMASSVHHYIQFILMSRYMD